MGPRGRRQPARHRSSGARGAPALAGDVGVTRLVPGGMATAFFDGRAEHHLVEHEDLVDPVVDGLEHPGAVVLTHPGSNPRG